MARRRRPYVGGYPAHVVQRGVDRGTTFFCDLDRIQYLEALRHCAGNHGVRIHAYVLMTNHVHLLATPEDADGVSLMMRDLGPRYVQRLNLRRGRTGTLWEGRHYAARIGDDRALLACHRYIEMNPVRAGLVRHPGAWRWSSHRANALGMPDATITPHPSYQALGTSDDQRRAAYATLFSPVVTRAPGLYREMLAMRRATASGATISAFGTSDVATATSSPV